MMRIPVVRMCLLMASTASAVACGAAPAGVAWSPSRADSLCVTEEQSLDAERTLRPIANGLQGALYTTRPRYRSSEIFEVFFEYRDAAGNPITGLSFEALTIPQDGAQTPPGKIALSSSSSDLVPGLYEGLVEAAPDWSSVTVLPTAPYVTPMAWDGGNDPQVRVDHSAPGRVVSHYVHPASSGAALTLLVDFDKQAKIALQVDVVGPDGSFLGQWTEESSRAPGQPAFVMPLPSGAITDVALKGQLVLSRAALQIDGVCSDLLRETMPLPVE